jgi:hypothetical protein
MRKSAGVLTTAILGFLAMDCTLAGQSFADCWVKVPLRPIHRTYIHRDVVEPGVYEIERRPSLYGWTRYRTADGYAYRRVLIHPYKNAAHFQRPYIAWPREHVTIQPEGFRWRRIRSHDC